MIDREHVLHVARLARLNLTEAEVGSFTRQMGNIIEYIDQLNQAPTDGIQATSVMASGRDSLRNDAERPSLDHEALLANGPQVKLDHFAVPKVIGN
jgi:aspartyl-tRNA(Asn)/glutamyl-tRNA(Gln) amidotransferase subunit C